MLPNKLTIGGHKFNVQAVEHVSEGDATSWGQVVYGTCEIRIRNKLIPSKQEAVLLHEALHVICDDANLAFKEVQIDTLGEAVYAFIKQNPHWIRLGAKEGA
jgi:hypothetical protein